VWNAAFGVQKDLSPLELKEFVKNQDSSSLKSLAVFLHLIQIEKQSKGMSDLEIMFSPDTGLLDTTLLVKKRDQAYKNFSEMSKIDKQTLENLRYKSLLSSFYKSDLILDIVLPLFPLRLNESIQNFISDKLINNGDAITQKYGVGQKGQERFTNTYNNSVVNYIFQNTMSSFNTPEGEILDLPESYNGMPVVKTEGQSEPVIIENGEIKVDMEKALADYNAKVFLNTNQGEDSHAKREMDTFSTSENPFRFASDYVRYLTELAYLKRMNPIESLEKNKRFRRFVANNNSEKLGYEKYLSEQALMKTYNYAFVMGTTKYSYTNMVMDIIQEFDSINLKENYPILNQLSPVKNIKEVNALELNDKSDAKGSLAESYYKNLRQLADESVRKVTDNTEAADADNKRISEVFEVFSLMMFYQHGTGYSKYGFNKVLDPAEYVSIMQRASNGFLNNNLKPLVFEEIYNRMIVKSMFKNFITTPVNYADPQPMSEEEKIQFLASAYDKVLASGDIEQELGIDEVEPEDIPEGPIEGPEDIKNFNKKNLFTVTPIQAADKKATIKASIATQYIGFGEGITGSSTETYRQQAGDLANTGNYSTNDVIFVSVVGKRQETKTPELVKENQDKTIKEAIKAVEAGATILTDNKEYIDSKPYNTGEKRLYANMEAKGYNYSEITVDGQVIGTWSKSTQPSTELTEDDFDLNITDQITILEGKLANLEDMKRILLESSVPVLIASNLPKIKPESARRETGVGVGTSKDINPGLLSNNGVSVERAAEIINEDLFYEGSGFPEIDVQDIRNYIIDILQTGVKSFIDEYTNQDQIDNIKADIGSLKQEMQNSKNKNTGIQLDMFSTENAPEGLPPIDRSSKECE